MFPKTETMPFPASELPVFANGYKFFQASAKLQAHAFKAMLKYQIQALTFLKHRYEQDMKLMDELIASDEFDDTFSAVSSFMQNAASEYSSEAGKMAALGSRIASDTAKRVRKVTEEAIEEKTAQPAA